MRAGGVSGWRIRHVAQTDSTNRLARQGRPGDVFTADFQTAGRGRLDHKWLSAPGENLMMSMVLDAAGMDAAEAATLPLVVGLAAVEGLSRFVPQGLRLKWPNDVLADGRKLCGILCERHGDAVIAGVGVNVRQRDFPAEIADRATSLARLLSDAPTVAAVRDAVLDATGRIVDEWRRGGLAALLPRLAAVDALRGRRVTVWRTDAAPSPLSGVCGGIASDGALLVGGERVYAGEARVRC